MTRSGTISYQRCWWPIVHVGILWRWKECFLFPSRKKNPYLFFVQHKVGRCYQGSFRRPQGKHCLARLYLGIEMGRSTRSGFRWGIFSSNWSRLTIITWKWIKLQLLWERRIRDHAPRSSGHRREREVCACDIGKGWESVESMESTERLPIWNCWYFRWLHWYLPFEVDQTMPSSDGAFSGSSLVASPINSSAGGDL